MKKTLLLFVIIIITASYGKAQTSYTISKTESINGVEIYVTAQYGATSGKNSSNVTYYTSPFIIVKVSANGFLVQDGANAYYSNVGPVYTNTYPPQFLGYTSIYGGKTMNFNIDTGYQIISGTVGVVFTIPKVTQNIIISNVSVTEIF